MLLRIPYQDRTPELYILQRTGNRHLPICKQKRSSWLITNILRPTHAKEDVPTLMLPPSKMVRKQVRGYKIPYSNSVEIKIVGGRIFCPISHGRLMLPPVHILYIRQKNTINQSQTTTLRLVKRHY